MHWVVILSCVVRTRMFVTDIRAGKSMAALTGKYSPRIHR